MSRPLVVAIQILRLVNSAAEVFGPLKSMTAGALYIAESVKKFKTSREDWRRLSARIQTHVAVVVKAMQEADSKKREDWAQNLEILSAALSRISERISDIEIQKDYKKWWQVFSSDGEIVEDLQRDFDEAIQLFQFQAMDKIINELQGASSKDIVGKLLTTVKEDIVVELNWKEAFSHLPNPVGTSWNPAYACLPGTRTAHRDEISAWISAAATKSAGTAEIFFVADALGSGKSALAHAVCERAHKDGVLVSSFFFNQQDATKSTTQNLFASIIRGLSNIDNQVRKAIAQRLDADSTLATAALIRQFDELVIPICHMLPAHRPIAIVIDALDEGYDEELLKILRDSVPLLPHTFRIVITSRPEARIMSRMTKGHIQRPTFSLSGNGNRDDIAKYVDDRLQQAEWGGEVSPELRASLIAKTQGLFLWAATVLNHVDKLYDPCAELQDLINNTSGSWTEGKDAENKLDNLYHQILSSFEWSDKKFVRAYKSIMGAIVTLKEPLSPISLSSLYAMEIYCVKDIARICSRMQTFLAGFDRNSLDQPIHLLHLSVQEYLTTRAPSTYRLDVDEHHSILASCCLTTIDKELVKESIPQLGYTEGNWDHYHTPWIPSIEREILSEQLWYSCSFFADHILLVRAENVSPSLSQLAKKVLSTKPRQLTEVTASMGRIANLGEVRKWALSIPGLYEEINRDDNLDEELALDLNAISRCLGKIGRFDEALKVSRDSVEIYSHLAAKRPAAFEHVLAASLNSLSNRLFKLGCHLEALTAIEKAVQIRRRLAEHQPAAFEPALATSLNNLSLRLSHECNHQEALAAIEEAVQIRRRLAAHQPAAFEPALAASLNNLSNCLSALGHHPESLTAIQEAVQIRRCLAAAQPAAFEPDLAMSLYNLSYHLSKSGRHAEALTPIEESVEIRRRLAKIQPAAFEPTLALSLGNLSAYLGQLGRHEDALKLLEEDIAIFRRLAANQPAIHAQNLAKQLHMLSNCLISLGHHKDAFQATQEARAITS